MTWRPAIALLGIVWLASFAGCGHDGVGRAGDLDLTFGSGGETVVDLGGARSDQPAAIAILSDGRIVVGGSSVDWQGDAFEAFTVTRLLPDGSLDRTFGAPAGSVRTHLGPVGIAHANAMVVQPDGKILLVGRVHELPLDGSTFGFGLARYLPDGELDGTFGMGGVVYTRPRDAPVLELNGELLSVALQPDGKIVAAGYLLSPLVGGGVAARMVVARYEADGTLDRGFGTGGLAEPDVAMHALAAGVVVQASGRIVLGGALYDLPANEIILVGFDPQGRADASFGDRGIAITRIPQIALEPQVQLQSLALARGDALVVLTNEDLRRYDADGRIEAGFGAALPATFSGRSLIVLDDDQVAVSGAGTLPNGDGDSYAVAVLRFRRDGTPDPTFGVAGLTRTRLRAELYDEVVVAARSDGRLVAAGSLWQERDLLVARFLP